MGKTQGIGKKTCRKRLLSLKEKTMPLPGKPKISQSTLSLHFETRLVVRMENPHTQELPFLGE